MLSHQHSQTKSKVVTQKCITKGSRALSDVLGHNKLRRLPKHGATSKGLPLLWSHFLVDLDTSHEVEHVLEKSQVRARASNELPSNVHEKRIKLHVLEMAASHSPGKRHERTKERSQILSIRLHLTLGWVRKMRKQHKSEHIKGNRVNVLEKLDARGIRFS
jgi:hypothetical protein